MKSYILVALVLIGTGFAGCAAPPSYKIDGARLHMYLMKPEAREVYFASSIDAFVLHPTRLNDSDTWEAVIPLGHGFRYFFIADGRITLPPCRYKERDDFGSQNCIFVPDL